MALLLQSFILLKNMPYDNKDMHLPNQAGRVWYEADINYTPGRRNLHRLFWSNDGLLFVTYNHGLTFYEII